jgi:PAS domain S-box-containing protein
MGMLLLNLVVMAVAAMSIYKSWEQYNQRARVAAENMSILLGREIGSVLNRISIALQNTVQAYELEKPIATNRLKAEHFNDFLRQQQTFLPSGLRLRVTDQDGIVRYGAGIVPGMMLDVSKRENFMLEKEKEKEKEKEADLVISAPVRALNRDEWVIPVSRRLNRPDGSFAGIAYVNIPTSFFVESFAALNVGANGLIALRNENQIMLARYPVVQTGGGAVGQFAISDQLRTLLQDNQSHPDQPLSFTYSTRSPSDGLERIFSYRQLLPYRLAFGVGLAPQDYLDDWEWDAASMAGALILFNLVTFLFTRSIIRAWRRQLASDNALSTSEERFHLLFKHSPIGIALVNEDNFFIDANDAFCHLVGYTLEELQVLTFLDVTHPDCRETNLANIAHLATGEIPNYSVEKRYLHKDGHVIWAHVFAVAIRNHQGVVLYRLAIVEDITERREAERIRIEQLERQRDILVREVHHRIKNNLQGIISLIEQLMLKQPAAADVLEEAAGQIGAIAVVHGLQGQTLSSEVRPRQLIRDIVDSIARLSVRVIECEEFDECKECNECDDFSNRGWCLNERDTVSIALVVNELIYNAIKHTPAGPAVSVAVRFGKQPDSFNIRVTNRPATLPASFDWAKAVGLGTGLTLVASLLPGQGAKLTIEQHDDTVEAHLQLNHPCVGVPPPVA